MSELALRGKKKAQDLVLYVSGDTDMRKGSIAGITASGQRVTFASDHIELDFRSNYEGDYAQFFAAGDGRSYDAYGDQCPVSGYDFTKYKTLKITALPSNARIGYGTKNSWFTTYQKTNSSTAKEYTFDISSLSGNYYILFEPYNPTHISVYGITLSMK